jgi:hypothetical protein
MRKVFFIIFAALIISFLLWNVHRSGMLNRQSESVIARADYLIERSERSIERWNNR